MLAIYSVCVLKYLVASKARRRLLLLLWREQARGSVSELAERADVAFATAHAELRAMQHAGLVTTEHDGRKEVFRANASHPAATALLALLAADAAAPDPANAADDDELRSQLVALGAPLRRVAAHAVSASDRMAVLANGATLARRDPVVARALPLCVWNLRDDLDLKELVALSPRVEEKHTLGFFLDLTSELGGDRRLTGLAESLRDRRVTSVREFFHGTHARPDAARDFPLARKWGFRMNMDLASFRSLFDKFVTR